MGLIKSDKTPTTLQPFSMKDVEQQARAILLRAQQRAEQLLAAAQREGEELKEAAQAQGHLEGREIGIVEGSRQGAHEGLQQALQEHRQKFSEIISTLAAALQEWNASRNEMEVRALREVVELAAAIARRVTKRQGLIDPQVLEANLVEVMKLAVQSADVRISIHPSQRKTLTDALPRLQMQWPALAHVELADDPSLSPGGCRLFLRGGQIDADIDGQLDRVIDELLSDSSEHSA
jgi:flagellar assembly protein FliH